MNILFLWTSPFKDAAGVGRVTESLALEFQKKGLNVYYFALTNGTDYENEGIVQYFAPNKKSNSKQNIAYLLKFIHEKKIDIIINQYGFGHEILKVIKIISAVNTKIFSVHHNCIKCLLDNYENIILGSYKNSKLYPFLNTRIASYFLKRYGIYRMTTSIQKALKYSDKLVLLSNRFVPELKTIVPYFPEDKVIGIPNPSPFRLVTGAEKHKENRLLFVGRIAQTQKRVDLLLKIWKRLYKNFPDWYFDIVGDGPELNSLKAKSKQMNLERIYFHGYTDPRPYLSKAKIFLMTSAYEGYGMVLVESQAYGVVPFAFNTFPNLKDIIKIGETGFYYEPFDLVDYTFGVASLMKNEERRKVIAVNAQKNVVRYYPEKVAEIWINMFKKELNEQ